MAKNQTSFKKGVVTNPKGRPKDPIKQQFLAALQTVEENEKKKLLQHLCEQAFIDNKVLVALAKKILPDITETNLKTDKPLLIQIIDDFK